MLSGVETGNRIPHDEWNLRGIAHAHTCTEKTTFFARTNNANTHMKGLAQCWGPHRALDIFRFAVFFVIEGKIIRKILPPPPIFNKTLNIFCMFDFYVVSLISKPQIIRAAWIMKNIDELNVVLAVVSKNLGLSTPQQDFFRHFS